MLEMPLISPKGPIPFGASNVLLTGSSTRYYVPHFAGPTAIKAVWNGEVTWLVGRHRYCLRPDVLLLLPPGEEYSMIMDTPYRSRTLCPVFRDGLVEDCLRAMTASPEKLLDEPDEVAPLSFGRRLESRSGLLGQGLAALAAAVETNAPPETLAWAFEDLGARVATTLLGQRSEVSRLTATRATTRAEVYRRLARSREIVEDRLSAPWTLPRMARAAAMSPHHYHRCFSAVYLETPRHWLSRRRAERAMALLRSGRYSVTEVCHAIGCSSIGSFSTAFTARFGMSPSVLVTFRRTKSGRRGTQTGGHTQK